MYLLLLRKVLLDNMKAKIVQFILDNFKNSTSSEVIRLINKSTIIVFKNNNILLADDNYIFAYGSFGGKFKSFHKENSKYLKDKLFYTKNIHYFKNHSVLIDGDKGLYRYV